MIKRWFEPIVCFLIAIIAWMCYLSSDVTLYIEPVDYGSPLWDTSYKLNLLLLSQFPFTLYQESFLWIIIFAVLGGLLLLRYRKIGVPILLIGGGLPLILSKSFYFYSQPTSYIISGIPTSLFTLALMPIVLSSCLIVIAILAVVRKPLSKDKVEAIKEKLE